MKLAPKAVSKSSVLCLQASELQNKIENAGGERLKNQKAKVTKIQSVSGKLIFVHAKLM